jgi:biopolymer transport protein ExbB/TolQ
MSSAQPAPLPRATAPKPRSLTTLAAFVFGIPTAFVLLGMIELRVIDDPLARRYISHPVEKVEVLLFCIAIGALLAKIAGFVLEWSACRRVVLPAWDGRALPVSEAGVLRAALARLGRRVQNTSLVLRCAAILDFVRSRQSANDLDDQMRALADNDALALENSYGLLRFITWAIPILGFLGTVLGITEAIAGVNPEALEISNVTDGLALAFDTTALALALTMIIMFVNYLIDRLETGMLGTVDRYVEEQLAHRFERQGAESSAFVAVVRQQTQVLLEATERLVEGQAAVWAKTLARAERHWHESGQKQQERLTVALETSLARTLDHHAQRLEVLEKQTAEQNKELLVQLGGLTQTLRETGRQHQQALAPLLRQMLDQTEAFARVQEDGKQLAQLQKTLEHNLATLASIGKFDEALHSLTAAIHLLTARAGPRPGVAA